MKKLIINADDLGLTRGVTRGIIAAHLKGVVTSTSAMLNSPHIAESLAAVRHEAPDLGVGVHLVLTWGKPMLPAGAVPSLVDSQGNFFKSPSFAGRIPTINLEEVRAEWRAQIEAFIATGLQPDHLDSHHHSSYASPALFATMLDLALEFDLPIRFPSKPEGIPVDSDALVRLLMQSSIHCPQSCITSFYDDGVSMENLTEIISTIPEGISELMCHPGTADRELIEVSSYNTARENELRILTRSEVKTSLDENGVLLAVFSDL